MKDWPARFNDLSPYVFGGVLVYLACFLDACGFSTVFKEKLVNGFVWGTLLWGLIEIVHVPIQFIARRLLKRFFSPRKVTENIFLIAPALAFVVYVLSAAVLSRPGEGMFKKDVANPIPPSAKVVERGRSR